MTLLPLSVFNVLARPASGPKLFSILGHTKSSGPSWEVAEAGTGDRIVGRELHPRVFEWQVKLANFISQIFKFEMVLFVLLLKFSTGISFKRKSY